MELYFCSGLLAKQNEQFEDVTLTFRKVWWPFSDFLLDQTINLINT